MANDGKKTRKGKADPPKEDTRDEARTEAERKEEEHIEAERRLAPKSDAAQDDDRTDSERTDSARDLYGEKEELSRDEQKERERERVEEIKHREEKLEQYLAGTREGIAGTKAQLFGFLGGVVAWALHFGITYGFAEISCNTSRFDRFFFGAHLSILWMVGWTLLFGFIAFWASYSAYSSIPARAVDHRFSDEVTTRSEFMAQAGAVMSGLAGFTILITGAIIFFVTPC